MIRGPALANTDAPIGPYLLDKLRELNRRLESIATRVAAPSDDAEAVHDLRVGLRRTRTLLEAGRPVLGRFHADEVRRALREVQQATGALRDEEVLLELVARLEVAHLGVGEWLTRRRQRERRLRSGLARLVRTGVLANGQQLLSALLTFRIKPSRDRRRAKFARRAVETARREVNRRRSAGSQDPDALHRLRIAYKRLRYTVEAFSDILPSDFASLAPAAARFQSRLGDLHDVDMALGSVRRARALPDEARAALLSALERLREDRWKAYANELGASTIVPVTLAAGIQDVGADSLRKISTR
jgi:CHAD domain-containing protein